MATSSCEVLIVLLWLLCARPDSVFLNRENHENRHLNDSKHGGFTLELIAKYGAFNIDRALERIAEGRVERQEGATLADFNQQT